MEEPPLLMLPSGASETYRFLWVRSFHSKVAVRVEKRPQRTEAVAKVLRCREAFKCTLINDFRKPLDERQWRRFKALLSDAKFWDLKALNDKPHGRDGAYWVLEGKKEERYRAVSRWSGDEIKIRETCLFLLKIVGLLPEDESQIY